MAKNTRKWALGALVAAAAGYAVGILTAPKSGKETRKDIQKATVKAKAEAERTLKRLHSDLDGLIARSKEYAKTLQATAQKELLRVIEKAQVAKDKARGILSALHEGGADDKELQQAIADVNQAINHLKQYAQQNGKKPTK